MYITEEMKERVVGKKISFDYNGKRIGSCMMLTLVLKNLLLSGRGEK